MILSNLLDKFQLDCHKLTKQTTDTTKSGALDKKTKHVGMSGAEYKSAQKHVKITHGEFYKYFDVVN